MDFPATGAVNFLLFFFVFPFFSLLSSSLFSIGIIGKVSVNIRDFVIGECPLVRFE